jgi:hypothetical protein
MPLDDHGPSRWTVAIVLSVAALTGWLFYAVIVAPEVIAAPKPPAPKPAACSCTCHSPGKPSDVHR